MKKFIMISAMLLLSACSTPIQVDNLNNPPPVFSPGLPSQIVTVPIKWTVLTQAQIQELAKKNDPNVVFYALDSQNFENLAVNMAEIQRYMQQEKVVILTYQKYYEGLMASPAQSSK